MRLRTKILIILSVAFILFEVIEYSAQKFIIFPSFLKLEKADALENLARVKQAITREAHHLSNFGRDWGSWDDTYSFVKTLSKQYIKANLTIDTFLNNNINLIYYIGTSGKIIWGKTYDLETNKEITITELSQDKLTYEHPLVLKKTQNTILREIHKNGILQTSHGYMLVSAQSILTSENKGPMRGTILMGRFINKKRINTLINQTKVDFKIIPINTNSKAKEICDQLTKDSPFLIRNSEENYLLVYTYMTDIFNNKAFLIKTKIPREISKKGIEATKYALFSILIAGFILLILIIFTLRRYVVKPINFLKKHVQQIIINRNYSLRIPKISNDEIGELAEEFDEMLNVVEKQTNKLAIANEQLNKLATIDSLTKIFNRRKFDEKLDYHWRCLHRDQNPLSIILCDVDYFKQFNDTYGHSDGDQCLYSVAQIINNNIRRPADIAARYGGEEFALILPNTELAGAEIVAEKIRKDVEDLQIKNEKSSYKVVTISLGIATITPFEQLSKEDIVNLADKALYLAKEKGRNQFCSQLNS